MWLKVLAYLCDIKKQVTAKIIPMEGSSSMFNIPYVTLSKAFWIKRYKVLPNDQKNLV